MRRATQHSRSQIEQGTDPEKWKVNVSTDGWFCPSREKLCIQYLWSCVQKTTNIICLHPFLWLSQPIFRKLFFSFPPALDPTPALSCFLFPLGFLVNGLCAEGKENFYTATGKEENGIVWDMPNIVLSSFQIRRINPHSQTFDMMS